MQLGTQWYCVWRIYGKKVWTDSNLPPEWKLEHRVLIPKPGQDNYNTCNAYRTVSVTDILGKCLEKVIGKGWYAS